MTQPRLLLLYNLSPVSRLVLAQAAREVRGIETRDNDQTAVQEVLCPLCDAIEGSPDRFSPGEVLLFIDGVDWYCLGVQVTLHGSKGSCPNPRAKPIHC